MMIALICNVKINKETKRIFTLTRKITVHTIKIKKMKKLIVTFIASLLFTTLALAGEKSDMELKGRVVETVNGTEQPVPFAYVYCEGTTISTYTNENGEYVLPVTKTGKYKVRFSHAGYAVVEKDVKVKKNSQKAEININKQEVFLTQL